MTDAEFFMKMRASFWDAEAFVEAAADRIEAQAAEIERLRGDLKRAVEERDAARRDAEEAEAYAGELEVKLAKAQGALHQIAGKKDYADDPWDIARTTLAELTGEK